MLAFLKMLDALVFIQNPFCKSFQDSKARMETDNRFFFLLFYDKFSCLAIFVAV